MVMTPQLRRGAVDVGLMPLPTRGRRPTWSAVSVITSAMEDACRVATALDLFEARSGLTSAEFEERYGRGEFHGATWALAWHSLVAVMATRPTALAR